MLKRVRAIIISKNKILLIKRIKKDSVYWVFPGGGVERGESKKNALLREMKEELGVEVKICSLFKKNRFNHKGDKQKEYFYVCEIINGILGSGTGQEYQPDTNYDGIHGIEWVGLGRILEIDLFPYEVRNAVYLRFNDADYYEKIKNLNIAHYSGEVSYYTSAPIRNVEKKLLDNLPADSSLLDLGCGSGRFSIEAAKRVRLSRQYRNVILRAK